MDPFIGQIQSFGFNFAPMGWAFCDGQLLPISQNTALFSLLGTTFGGDGRSTFGLPNLKGRSIVHPGTGPGLSTVTWGQSSGGENVTLLTQNIPSHSHILVPGTGPEQVHIDTVVRSVSGGPINESDNGENPLGTGGAFPDLYSDSMGGNDKVGGVSSTVNGSTSKVGSDIAFNIRNPFLGVFTCIALQGIYPSRN